MMIIMISHVDIGTLRWLKNTWNTQKNNNIVLLFKLINP